MVNEALIKYVKDNLKKGFSREDTTRALRKAGYTEEEIKSCFSAVEKVPFKKFGIEEKTIITIGTFIVVVILGFFAYGRLQQQASIENMQYVWVSNVSSCTDSISTVSKECMEEHKIKLESIEDCDMVADSRIEVICRSLLQRDINMCDQLSDEEEIFYYKMCFLYHYVAQRDLSQCDKLQTPYDAYCKQYISDQREVVLAFGARK